MSETGRGFSAARRSTIALLALAGMVALLAVYVVLHRDDFRALRLVSLQPVALLFALTFIHMAITGFAINSPIRGVGVRLSVREILAVAVLTRFFNQITPFRGGILARGLYLKQRHNLSPAVFASTVGATYVLTQLVAGAVGLIACGVLYLEHGTFSGLLTGLFSVALISAAGLIAISGRERATLPAAAGAVRRALEGWRRIRSDTRLVLAVCAWTCAQLFVRALMLQLQFEALGIRIELWHGFVLGAVMLLGFIIAITPANLGVEEGLIVLSATLFGITPAVSISAAILGRVVLFALLAVLGPIVSLRCLHTVRPPRDLGESEPL